MADFDAKMRTLMSSGRLDSSDCKHVNQVQDIMPSGDGCKECLESGDRWVHLRICMTCGQVGCCNSSKNRHATKHYKETGHPIVMSFESGEEWLYCYEDREIV